MFWGKNEWHKCPDAKFPVSPRDDKRIDEAGYRLAIGHEVYLAEGSGANTTRLGKNKDFCIKPGQFAFIITEEIVTLPGDMIAFISVRAGIKFYGLVNVSGFHVDPGYTGHLIFAVFNAGPTRINLRRGQDIFSIWVAELKSPIKPEDFPKKSYYSIDSEIINKLDGQHLNAYQVNQRLNEFQDQQQTELKSLESRVRDNDISLKELKTYIYTGSGVLTVLVLPIFIRFYAELLKPILPFLTGE